MIVDLSMPIRREMPGFPGYPAFNRRQIQTFAEDGKVAHEFSMTSHTGTHVDAPAHFIPGGAAIDEIPLDRFVGDALVIDLRDRRGLPIEAPHLANRAAGLSPGDRVVLVTGDVDHRFEEEDFFDESAVLTPSAAEWLIAQDVSLVANDFLTESIRDPDRPVHNELLGSTIPIVEYLCSTDTIADEKRIELACLPLCIEGMEAAPARVIARCADAVP